MCMVISCHGSIKSAREAISSKVRNYCRLIVILIGKTLATIHEDEYDYVGEVDLNN